MAGEDLGNKADDTEQQGGAEPTGAEQNPASDGSGDEGDGDVKDSHGQPGINKERHDREIAEKDAKIAELEASKPRKDDGAEVEAAAPAQKICPICGAASDSKFCPQCGAPMGD